MSLHWLNIMNNISLEFSRSHTRQKRSRDSHRVQYSIAGHTIDFLHEMYYLGICTTNVLCFPNTTPRWNMLR